MVRWALVSVFLLVSTMTISADTFVYVSMAPEQKIQVYRLDLADGNLTPVEAVAVEGAPGSLTFDPKQQFLFASLRTTSKLASFRVDPKTGKLTPINSVALPKGENAAFVRTDRTGRWLISASYMAGKVVVHGITADGSLKSPAVQTVETARTAHCVTLDAANGLVFVPHVSTNSVFQFRLDPTTGMLKEAGQAKGGAEKAGPRHLAFHPSGKFAFTSDETGSSITAYSYEAGKGLTPMQTLSTLPADYTASNTTAEVKVHPSGKFVWVSNRGHESLAGFAIDEKTGRLTAIGQTPTEKTPRSFEIDPSGRYLFGAGEGNGKLVIFEIEATGKLVRRRTLDVGKSLTWVQAVRFDEK